MLKPAVWLTAAAALAAAAIFIDENHPGTSVDYSRTPVLFVHGHGLSSDDWTSLLGYLVRQGYPPEYLSAIDIRPNQMANEPAAKNVIAPAVEALLRRANETAERHGQGQRFERVNLVGHSMGAFSSRWYAARLRPDRVRTWIGIAGANHGTNTLCEYNDAGAADMCPAFAESATESFVQTTLNGAPGGSVDESPFGIGEDPPEVQPVPPDEERAIVYFTIRLEPDDWIVPADSAVLRGAGGVSIDIPAGFDIRQTSPGNFRSYRRLDHMSILDDQEVHWLTWKLLAATPAD